MINPFLGSSSRRHGGAQLTVRNFWPLRRRRRPAPPGAADLREVDWPLLAELVEAMLRAERCPLHGERLLVQWAALDAIRFGDSARFKALLHGLTEWNDSQEDE